MKVLYNSNIEKYAIKEMTFEELVDLQMGISAFIEDQEGFLKNDESILSEIEAGNDYYIKTFGSREERIITLEKRKKEIIFLNEMLKKLQNFKGGKW